MHGFYVAPDLTSAKGSRVRFATVALGLQLRL